MDLLVVFLSGIFLFSPALLPNSAAVLFGGGTPVDMGRSWRGQRILGDGKTWRGLIGGVSAGTSLGILLALITIVVDAPSVWRWGYGLAPLGLTFSLALGSLLGDLGGAFIKRRLGMKRGEKAIGLDQYDFVMGGMVMAFLTFPQWTLQHYFEGEAVLALIALLVFVPVLHRGINIIGFKLGKKKEPW